MIKKIDVLANKTLVGTLALTKDRQIVFQYSDEWVQNGFSLNPFKLPLSRQLFVSSSPYFRGLFGVFADSLPDSYGELLLERFLRQKKIDIRSLSPLDRLAYVGASGMGLLEYVPDFSQAAKPDIADFDWIQEECNALLDSKEVQDIETLYSLGGSSGGARPKSLIRYKGEDWIVKFSSRFDPKDIADLEFRYMSLAKSCGIRIPDIELVTSKKGGKYFLIKRFDRHQKDKVHMISVAALLECDFRAPALDYNDLIKLTRILTGDDEEAMEMYRRMVFNVLIDNQDDHAKNFSFLFDATNRVYRLSPAYDITPGRTYFGEHTTSVNGKGKGITDQDMLLVAKNNRLNMDEAKAIIQKCKKVLTNAAILGGMHA